MFTVLIQNDKEGERKSKLDEENLLNETHTHGMYTTELMLAFFSSNLDCNLFRRNFFSLCHPPIPFTKSSDFSFANTLIYGKARDGEWSAREKRNELNESNWSKHAHPSIHSANNKHHQPKATLTHLLPQQSNCVDLFAIHKEFIQYQVCVYCISMCVSFPFHEIECCFKCCICEMNFFPGVNLQHPCTHCSYSHRQTKRQNSIIQQQHQTKHNWQNETYYN